MTMKKIGIGVVGVRLSQLPEQYNTRTCSKVCLGCGCKPSDPDPINPTLSYAWFKPDYGGLVCAYCGTAKARKYPHKSNDQVFKGVRTNEEEWKKFQQFCKFLIESWKSGKQRVRNVLDAPMEQTVKKIAEINVSAADKGKMKLYDSYVQEFGDPATNGRGHTITMAQWKDGSKQKVVLIPMTASDEMECKWEIKNGFRHDTTLDDGALSMRPDQQRQLFDSLRDAHGVSRLSGDIQPSGGAAAVRRATADRAKAALDARSAPSAMPPSLPTGRQGGAGRRGVARPKAGKGKAGIGAADLAKEERELEKLVEKGEACLRELAAWSRETIVREKDERFYKATRSLSDSIAAKNTSDVTASNAELAEKAEITVKLMGLMVQRVKAYTTWVKKAEDKPYLDEIASMTEFSMKEPMVTLELPVCIQCDAMELEFRSGICDAISEVRQARASVEDSAEVADQILQRWQTIDLANVQRLYSHDKAVAEQHRMVKETFLDILNHADLNKLSPEDTLEAMRIVLSPIPRDSPPASFDLGAPVLQALRSIKSVVLVDRYAGRGREALDDIAVFQSSDNEILMQFKTPAGLKMLRCCKDSPSSVVKVENSVNRLREMSGKTFDTVAEIIMFDKEFHLPGVVEQAGEECATCLARNLDAWIMAQSCVVKGAVKAVLDGSIDAESAGEDRVLSAPALTTFLAQVPNVLKMGIVTAKTDAAEAYVHGLDLLKAIAAGPLLLLKPDAAGSCNMAHFERLAHMIQDISVCYSSSSRAFEKIGYSQTEVRVLLNKAIETLRAAEAAVVTPKVSDIAKFLYCDSSYIPGPDAAAPDAAAAAAAPPITVVPFIREMDIERLATLYDQHRGSLSQVADHVQDAVAMLSALARPEAAAVLQVKFALVRVRLRYARCYGAMADSRTEFVTLDAWLNLVAGLAADHAALTAVFASETLAEMWGAFVGASAASASALRQVEFAPVKTACEHGLEKSGELIITLVGNWALRLSRWSQKLLSEIPSEWNSFVVKVFDVERIKSELLAKKWDAFARGWASLQRLFSQVRGFECALTGKFDSMHAATSTSVSGVLLDGKKFIAAIASCALIVEKLPNLPSVDRVSVIEQHLSKARSSSALPPPNIVDFLGKELKKAKAAGNGGKK
ncbi:unnamed protein product, partial [Prorocentrum cordatum]